MFGVVTCSNVKWTLVGTCLRCGPLCCSPVWPGHQWTLWTLAPVWRLWSCTLTSHKIWEKIKGNWDAITYSQPNLQTNCKLVETIAKLVGQRIITEITHITLRNKVQIIKSWHCAGTNILLHLMQKIKYNWHVYFDKKLKEGYSNIRYVLWIPKRSKMVFDRRNGFFLVFY